MFTWHGADEQALVWKLELGLAGDGQGWVVMLGEPCCAGRGCRVPAPSEHTQCLQEQAS